MTQLILVMTKRQFLTQIRTGRQIVVAQSLVADKNRCIALNATSLALGMIGNVFLLFNFTKRIRYIIALPMTIILWYFATGIVSSSTPLWKLLAG